MSQRYRLIQSEPDPGDKQNSSQSRTPHAQEDPAEAALLMAGRHLLNVLRSEEIEPATVQYQADAVQRVWPTPWAYDAWSAWHACRIGLRHAGYDPQEISVDRRDGWRTAGQYRESPPKRPTLGAVLSVLKEVLEHAEALPEGTVEEIRGAVEELESLTGLAGLPDIEPSRETPASITD